MWAELKQAASLPTLHTLLRNICKYNIGSTLGGLLHGPPVATKGSLVFPSDAQQSPIGEKTRKGS